MAEGQAEAPKLRCVVVGAGPVGALAALYAANRGWDVEVFDLRGDLRDPSTVPLNFTRSINLALSERGINALRTSGSPQLLDAVLAEAIPMYGRMIHCNESDGTLTEVSQLYDIHGRFLRAIDRGSLNKTLLDAVAKLPNVKLNFYHKLTGADFRRRKAWFERRTACNERIDEIEVDFDIVLGCDGAHSRVRYHLMKFVRMCYSQSYIDTLWCEFTIPPVKDAFGSTTTPSAKDGFATSPNHLHIWPDEDMMFIAIPSIDGSFTCTLFAPQATFCKLERNPETIELFFNTHFPGAADLIGPSKLRQQFETNPHLPLVSVKCKPHHFGGTGVVLGDAAHAMVPFYGQGMNAGLEDVRILFEHLDAITPSKNIASPSARAEALATYSAMRVPDAHTINDLAFQNYWEMHAGVCSRTRQWRKSIEEFLAVHVPAAKFVTQYTRVSFTNEPYSSVARAVERQQRVLATAMLSVTLTPVALLATWWTWRSYGMRNSFRHLVNGVVSGTASIWGGVLGILHRRSGR